MYSKLVVSLFAVVAPVLAGPVITSRQAYMNGLHSLLNNNGLSGLSNAVTQAQGTPQGQNLFNQVGNGGQHTLVAPTNVGSGARLARHDAALVNFLSYHFLNSSVPTNSVGAGHTISSSLLTDPSVVKLGRGKGQVQILEKTEDGVVIRQNVGSARITKSVPAPDLNLILHIIENPLKTPGGVSAALTSALVSDAPNGFPKLLDALEDTELEDEVNNDAKTTFLAPIDCAFDEKHDDLKKTLLNHIIKDNVVYSSDFDDCAEAASGAELKFVKEGGDTYVKMGDKQVKILRSDVPTENGVMHVVDGLLC